MQMAAIEGFFAMTPITDLPGIERLARQQAALPPAAPPVPTPERVAPEGVNRSFGFDHRMGSGGTHGGEL